MGGQYKSTVGSVFSLNYPLIWCPKYRRKVLVGNAAVRLKELLREKANPLDVDIEALEIMRSHPAGQGACVIGSVTGEKEALVTMKSKIGAARILDMLSGEQLPRIC